MNKFVLKHSGVFTSICLLKNNRRYVVKNVLHREIHLLPEIFYWTVLCYGTRAFKYANEKYNTQFSYYAEVWHTTENVSKNLKGIELRGWDYCIDHIVPISVGFSLGVPADIIGSLENLQIVEHKRNLQKGRKLTEQGRELLIKWYNAGYFGYE